MEYNFLDLVGLTQFFEKLKSLFVLKNDLVNIKGETGTRGSQTYMGTAIIGTSTTATIFNDSGINSALENDLYLNTNTWNVYQCTTAGTASVAKWTYKGNIKGVKGDAGSTPTLDFEVKSDGHLYVAY